MISKKKFQFELHPHIGEVCTETPPKITLHGKVNISAPKPKIGSGTGLKCVEVKK